MFAPPSDAEAVRAAIAEAGAGRIGDYDSCSWMVTGEGRFRPLEGAHPTIGRVGDLEQLEEVRIEAVLPRTRRAAVVRAMLAAHSYEKVAFDVIELADAGAARTGAGRVGEVDETTLGGYAATVAPRSRRPRESWSTLTGPYAGRGAVAPTLSPEVLAPVDVYHQRPAPCLEF